MLQSKTLITCPPVKLVLLTFNNINFGKTWSLFRRNMIDVFLSIMLPKKKKKSKNAPNITVILWRKMLTRSGTKVGQDSVYPKAPLRVTKQKGRYDFLLWGLMCIKLLR